MTDDRDWNGETWIHLNHPCYGIDVCNEESDLRGQGYIQLKHLRALLLIREEIADLKAQMQQYQKSHKLALQIIARAQEEGIAHHFTDLIALHMMLEVGG